MMMCVASLVLSRCFNCRHSCPHSRGLSEMGVGEHKWNFGVTPRRVPLGSSPDWFKPLFSAQFNFMKRVRIKGNVCAENLLC